MLQPPLRRNCCGRCIRLPRPRLSPIRPWPVVVKQNPYDSAHGHHVEHCGNAHLKDQVDRRLDSDDHQEREHGTEEKDGGNRPFRPGPKVTHRWTIAGLLTGAIVRHRPSKTRWPRPERGQKYVGGSAGLVPGALAATGRATWESAGECGSAASPDARELLRPFALAPVPAAKPAGLSARRRRVVRPIASTIIDTTQSGSMGASPTATTISHAAPIAGCPPRQPLPRDRRHVAPAMALRQVS